jgi:rod shape-determining protein MreD
LLIVQSVFVPCITVRGIAPDLMLIFLVYWAHRHNRLQAVLIGFVAGLIQDLAGQEMAGLYALSKSVACYVAGSLTLNRYQSNPVFLAVVLLITTLSHHLIYTAVQSMHLSSDFFTSLLRYAVPSVFYTVLIGLGVYALINAMLRYFRRQ